MLSKTIITTLLLLLPAVAAQGQAGSIGIFSNSIGTEVDLMDDAPGILSVYFVHVHAPGATACQFWAPKPWCLEGSYIGESSPFATTIGNSQIGIAVAYGLCLCSPIHVLTIQFSVQGNTPNCCCYFIFPDPTANPPGIYVTDCALPTPNVLEATGGLGVINRNSQCTSCTLPATCINWPVPVEDTTWGRVKALFTN